jgi:hypothetical protein
MLSGRAVRLPRCRLVSVTRATAATEASASPRKPSVPTRSRSSSEPIFEVAWRTGRAPVRRARCRTVVADADQLDAAFFELDLDRRAAGVEGVLEQFLEH